MKIMKRISSLLTLVCDANGNITDYIDGSGNVVAHREFDPCGNTIVATGAMVNDFNFWFSSKCLDAETGLYYYGLRYYSANLSRWICRDLLVDNSFLLIYDYIIDVFSIDDKESEIHANQYNLYLFANNSSIRTIDLFGLYGCPSYESPVGERRLISVKKKLRYERMYAYHLYGAGEAGVGGRGGGRRAGHNIPYKPGTPGILSFTCDCGCNDWLIKETRYAWRQTFRVYTHCSFDDPCSEHTSEIDLPPYDYTKNWEEPVSKREFLGQVHFGIPMTFYDSQGTCFWKCFAACKSGN